MNRRNFLRLIPAAIVAGVVAPKLLIPKEQPIKPFRWIDKKEWDNYKYFLGCDPASGNDNMGIIILKTRRKGYTYMYPKLGNPEEFKKMMDTLYVHYRDRSFFDMHV
jgi:hypothetical protein